AGAPLPRSHHQLPGARRPPGVRPRALRLVQLRGTAGRDHRGPRQSLLAGERTARGGARRGARLRAGGHPMTSNGDSVAAMFVSAARAYPDRTFLRWCRGDERITWSYADAAVRIEALATRLDELGITAGDHVVVHTAEMVPSILFDLACACAGVVFTPLETTSLPAVLDLCVRIDARAVLTTPDRIGPYDGRPIVAEDGRAASAGDPALAIARLGERARRRDGDTTYMLQPTS